MSLGGFSRQAIVNAHAALAIWTDGNLNALPKRARYLADVRNHDRARSYSTLFDTLDSFDLESVVAFFTIWDKRRAGDDRFGRSNHLGEECAERYARSHDPRGVTIHLSNDDGDPCRVTFTIQDLIADAWADRNGSLAGGTWEQADGEDYVYDTTYWYPGLVKELQDAGYKLDMSDYSDPDEIDVATSDHACGDCTICCDDLGRARENYGDRTDIEREAHIAQAAAITHIRCRQCRAIVALAHRYTHYRNCKPGLHQPPAAPRYFNVHEVTP